MNYRAILAKLNEIKKQRGMTLKDLSEKSGISQGTINKIMSGATQKIKADNIARLCSALGVPQSVVLGEASPSEPIAQPVISRPIGKNFGLVKIACISPQVKVADCAFNVGEIAKRAAEAANAGAKVLVFPELCITGYTCGDLFFTHTLRQGAIDGLFELCGRLRSVDAIVFVGLPLVADNGLMYNVCAAIFRGQILGIVPKMHLPNYNEFEEKRIFAPHDGKTSYVTLFGKQVPFGSDLLFVNDAMPEMKIAAEICEDIWVSSSPSYKHAEAGATVIVNLSSSNETVVKAAYRRKLVEIQSGKTCSVYAYCSSAMSESTSATVFSAHDIICENSQIVAESLPFGRGYAQAEVDLNFIANERAKMAKSCADGYQTIRFDMPVTDRPTRVYEQKPFVPSDPTELAERCETILTIQAYALKKRIEHTHAKKLVIGVSGGSDSSLALLVCQRALELLRRPMTDILAFTMPCFGTSVTTMHNSIALANTIGATVDKIDISKSVKLHLQDIGHNANLRDVTYENAQARERTQVLMDIANRENGLVVGTGDMSELALGWCTYNGDQMSTYAVNSSVPKTLVLAILQHVSDVSSGALKRVLADIVNTPISPELLPAEQGEITQLTENVVGPYELHDYFLFMLTRKGFSPSKVYNLALLSFGKKYSAAEIYKWERKFLSRFFTQQFKRGCSPDGVRLGSADLSRASFHMPSDACAELWIADLDNEYNGAIR